MALRFGEVIQQGLSPTERLYLGISSLGVVAEEIDKVELDQSSSVSVVFECESGMAQYRYGFCYAGGVYLPSFERWIQSGSRLVHELHTLDENKVGTVSLLGNGLTMHGGAEQITTMARGVEIMADKIMAQTLDGAASIAWRIDQRTVAE